MGKRQSANNCFFILIGGEYKFMDYLHIAVISNIIFDQYFVTLVKKRFSPINIEIHPIPFYERAEQEYKEYLLASDIIIVWFNYEEMFRSPLAQNDVVNVCRKLMDDLSEYNALKLWFLFEDYYDKLNICIGNVPLSTIDRINMKLADDGLVFIDLKRLIADVGVNNAYDDKGKYRWNAPYSKVLIQAAVNEIHKQYLIDKGMTKKCLVLDCDGVLWGGILSEDGVENIRLGGSGLGRAYQDFQRFILSLYYHSVILAICSKNDLSDVMRIFHEHSEMILKEEHIASFQVNWNHKADNIRRIADTLNIGLNSMVFIDDSDFEIESIKQLLPEVTAIKYERDTIYSQLSCFNLKSDVDMENIRQRNNTYKTNEQRVKLKDNSKSFDDYLKVLEMKVDIHIALPIEYARIAELTQRTNKCTNGTRYTIAEIMERVSSDSINLYSVSVSDRFSDLGIVGSFEVDGEAITLFSLSCRALGREVESKMLKYISKNYQIHNIVHKSTGKNDGIKNLLTATFPNATITNCENA